MYQEKRSTCASVFNILPLLSVFRCELGTRMIPHAKMLNDSLHRTLPNTIEVDFKYSVIKGVTDGVRHTNP